MKIIIPSRGRADKLRTLEFIPHEFQKDTIVVCPDEEVEAYQHNVPLPVSVRGSAAKNIREKRQEILDKWGRTEKIIMMDDDLRFRYRAFDKFERATPADVSNMLKLIMDKLNDYVHIGIADEFMCQHNPPGGVEGKRYNQVLAYNLTGIANAEIPKFRVDINEEHDFHLQLRKLGHPPFVLTDYTKGSKYQATGGCSTWRTADIEREAFYAFERLWPGVVSVVPGKGSISGLATRVAWRKVG